MRIGLREPRQLAYRWWIEYNLAFGSRLPRPQLEQLVHELAHAATLGFPKPQPSDDIGAEISRLKSVRFADENEAQTCAVELEVMARLGIRGFESALARVAGANLSHFGTAWLCRRIPFYRRTRRTRRFTNRVLSWLADGLADLRAEV